MKNKPLWYSLLTATALLAGVLAYQAFTATGWFKPRPNIILILTDDLDLTLMPYVPNINKLIGEAGATFTNYFISDPLCCPSRASILRGQYAHNTNILENAPGFVNFYRNTREEETLATWLNGAGYNTSLTGKYFNTYPLGAGKRYVPPGWTNWHAFLYEEYEKTFYYGYKMVENGEVVQYGDTPADYSTDVIKGQALRFIEQSIADGKPFFAYIAPIAPHGPSTPAERHTGLYTDLVFPSKPSFGEADLSDKPAAMRATLTPGDEFAQYDADALFIRRAQTMQAVDELVLELVNLLEQHGQLENTYIFFTSDNGLHMGEHGLPSVKGYPYEEDIKVPMLVRGPGIPPNSVVEAITANIDIAPTISALTGVRFADFIDGRSWLPLLKPQPEPSAPWRNAILIESGYWDNEETTLRYRGIRTENYIYLEYASGEIEFYDLRNDPYQLENIGPQLDPALQTALHAWLEQMKLCQADGCRSAEDAVPPEFVP